MFSFAARMSRAVLDSALDRFRKSCNFNPPPFEKCPGLYFYYNSRIEKIPPSSFYLAASSLSG